MKKSTLIKMGAGALVGAAIGFGIDMVVKHHKQKQVNEVKTNEEIVKENVQKMSNAVDLVVKTTCAVCAVYVGIKVVDYISEVDTKATVSIMLSFINGAKLGIIDKDTVKFALENALPTLDECSQRMLKEYANVALPELLGGE